MTAIQAMSHEAHGLCFCGVKSHCDGPLGRYCDGERFHSPIWAELVRPLNRDDLIRLAGRIQLPKDQNGQNA